MTAGSPFWTTEIRPTPPMQLGCGSTCECQEARERFMFNLFEAAGFNWRLPRAREEYSYLFFRKRTNGQIQRPVPR